MGSLLWADSRSRLKDIARESRSEGSETHEICRKDEDHRGGDRSGRPLGGGAGICAEAGRGLWRAHCAGAWFGSAGIRRGGVAAGKGSATACRNRRARRWRRWWRTCCGKGFTATRRCARAQWSRCCWTWSRQYEAGLLVVGTRGRDGAGPVAVGAIAEQLVRRGAMPGAGGRLPIGMRARSGRCPAGRCCWQWNATMPPARRWKQPVPWRRSSSAR